VPVSVGTKVWPLFVLNENSKSVKITNYNKKASLHLFVHLSTFFLGYQSGGKGKFKA